MRDTILYGDCRKTLKQFDKQARTCITSPPYYGLRDYGGEENQIGQEQTPDEFIEQLIDAGYSGETNEEIVNGWFRTIAMQILEEEGLDTQREIGYINVKPIDKDKSEVS